MFDVTGRTIYRVIRSLETAGVPINAEPGVGYFLEPIIKNEPICTTTRNQYTIINTIIECEVKFRINAQHQAITQQATLKRDT